MDAQRMQGQYKSEMVGQQTRVCSFCGEAKPLTEFARSGIDATGEVRYRTDCRTCYNIRRKENKPQGHRAASGFIAGQRRRGDDDARFTLQDWKEVLIFFGGTCAYCGCTPKRGQRLTKEHVIALMQGGKTEPGNIIPACKSCNSSKGPRDFKTWFMEQRFFSQDRLNKIYKWRNIMKQIYGEPNY